MGGFIPTGEGSTGISGLGKEGERRGREERERGEEERRGREERKREGGREERKEEKEREWRMMKDEGVVALVHNLPHQ